jgi:hypothetical protein
VSIGTNQVGTAASGCGAQVRDPGFPPSGSIVSRAHGKMPIPVVTSVVESLDKPSAYRDGEKEKERD